MKAYLRLEVLRIDENNAGEDEGPEIYQTEISARLYVGDHMLTALILDFHNDPTDKERTWQVNHSKRVVQTYLESVKAGYDTNDDPHWGITHMELDL